VCVFVYIKCLWEVSILLGIKFSRFFRLIVCCVVIVLIVGSLNVSFASQKGYTVDDARELLGLQRVDELFTEEEKRSIVGNFNKIELQNIAARVNELGEQIELPHIEARRELEYRIKGVKDNFVSSFIGAKGVSVVLGYKAELNSLSSRLSQMRGAEEDIDIPFMDNVWEEKHLEVRGVLQKISEDFVLGDIGTNMRPTTGNSFIITSPFGITDDPFNPGGTRVHNGIDVVAQEGMLILAQWNGVVRNIFEDDKGGLVIELAHGDNMLTNYMHLSSVLVEKGQHVRQYQPIARAGSSGKVTGAHLHLEVVIDGEYVNPVFLFGVRGANALRVFASRHPNSRGDTLIIADKIKGGPRVRDGEEATVVGDVSRVIPPRVGEGGGEGHGVDLKLPEGYTRPDPGLPPLEELIRGR